MKGWIKERKDERVNKRKDEIKKKRMKGWKDEIKERMDERMK